MVAIPRSGSTNPIDVSQTMPQIPPVVIKRDNMLFAIEDLFRNDFEVVIVEGEEGIGKTTLLAQFALVKSPRVAVLFIRPSSRFMCDLGNLRFDLCNQLNVFLRNKEIEVRQYSDSFFNNQLLELGRMTRDEPFFFVVDGLCELPRGVRCSIINLLPIGLRGLRFLFSGNSTEIMPFIKKVPYKAYTLAAFTVDEAQRYLADTGADEHAIQSIWRTCRGLPGYLSGVRRVLLSGTDIQSFVADMPSRVPDLFEVEWQNMPDSQPQLLSLLALLAFDRRQLTVNKLSGITGLMPDEIRLLLEPIKFVSIDSRTEIVQFISEQFRKFAEGKLSHLRNQVMQQVIDDLLNMPDTVEREEYLPMYYADAGRYAELMSFLSPEHFVKMMEHCQSIGPIQQRIDMAVETATRMNFDADLFRFSLQRSSLSQIGDLDIWRSEIDALMALSRTNEAIALAQSPVLREERLQLLAAIAKAEAESGRVPRAELVELIKQLWSQADISALGQRAIDIASDLVCCLPSLAIEMVEKANVGSGNTESLDEGLAQLLTAALQSKTTDKSDAVHSISQKISNPRARFLITVASAVAKYSASQVLAETDKLEKIEDKLLLLRQWAKVNRENPEADKVIGSAIDLIIHATEYTPNARIFRELASPLPYLDESPCRTLVSRFDRHIADIEKHGPTEEYIRLQLTLARAISRWDTKAFIERLVDIWSYVERIQDQETKCTCLAWFWGFLKDLDAHQELEKREGLHSLIEASLDESIEGLLSRTAEHFSVTERVIRALAEYDLPAALDIVRSYNTRSRRDSGLATLVETLTSLPPEKMDLEKVADLVLEITAPDHRDGSAFNLVEYLYKHANDLADRTQECKRTIDLIAKIENAPLKCRALCLAYRFLANNQKAEFSDVLPCILDQLSLTWESIDTTWVRVDTGFRIASELAAIDTELAVDYFDKSKNQKADLAVNDWGSAVSYLLCVRLAIRVYSRLLQYEGPPQVADIQQLEYLINKIPSAGEKARLWSVVALYCYINKHSDSCKEIVLKYVKPYLRDIADEDRSYKNWLTVFVAPALFVAHKATALEMLDKLRVPLKDYAYLRICEFLFTRTIPDEPYTTDLETGWRISYEEAVDICELCSHMEEDLPLSICIRRLCESMAHHGDLMTAEQKTDLMQRVERLIASKLPDLKNIKHQGYVVINQAALEHVKPTRQQRWNRLVDEAKRIPNVADRVFVLAVISSLMPSAERSFRDEVFVLAKEQVEEISSLYDRLGHYQLLAELAQTQGDKKWFLEMTMKASLDSDEPRFDTLRRKIINTAYRIDPELAEKLVSLTDKDPARAKARNAARSAYEVSRLTREIMEGKVDTDSRTIEPRHYAEAAWRSLGYLNSGRLRLLERGRVRQMLEKCSTFSFYEAYPVLSWLCQNLILSCPRDTQGLSTLRSLFEATILGAELIGRLSVRSPDALQHSVEFIREDKVTDSSLILGPGDFEKAINYLKDWFAKEQPEYLKICDPYFGPEDLWVLKLIAEEAPSCKVKVLTSRYHHLRAKIETPWSETYFRTWKEITELDPPETEIVVAGFDAVGYSPIHDRWLVSNGRGLRLGGSFNTSKGGKYSDISPLSREEAYQREKLIEGYLEGRVRTHKGGKIRYERFNL